MDNFFKKIKKYLFIIFLISCGGRKENSSLQKTTLFVQLESKTYENLVFTATDSKYQSSTIYSYDFSKGEISSILEGQSGDPQLYVMPPNHLWLFNRSHLNYNFLSLTKNKQQNFSIGQAQLWPYGEKGDPHQVIPVDNNYLLLSCPGSHDIKIMNPQKSNQVMSFKNSQLFQNIQAEDMILKKDDHKTYLFILHRGTFDHIPDNSQGIYVYELNQSTHEMIFKRFLATGSSFHSKFHTWQENHSYALMHLCYKNTFFSEKCYKSFEIFYPDEVLQEIKFSETNGSSSANSLKVLSDLEHIPWKSAGPSCSGSHKSIYLLAEHKTKDQKAVIKLSASNPSKKLEITVVHVFSSDSIYSPFLVYDKYMERLFIAECFYNNSSKFFIYEKDQKKHEIDFDFCPYQGVLLSKAI